MEVLFEKLFVYRNKPSFFFKRYNS